MNLAGRIYIRTYIHMYVHPYLDACILWHAPSMHASHRMHACMARVYACLTACAACMHARAHVRVDVRTHAYVAWAVYRIIVYGELYMYTVSSYTMGCIR
jgi:hypothetical protein